MLSSSSINRRSSHQCRKPSHPCEKLSQRNICKLISLSFNSHRHLCHRHPNSKRRQLEAGLGSNFTRIRSLMRMIMRTNRCRRALRGLGSDQAACSFRKSFRGRDKVPMMRQSLLFHKSSTTNSNRRLTRFRNRPSKRSSRWSSRTHSNSNCQLNAKAVSQGSAKDKASSRLLATRATQGQSAVQRTSRRASPRANRITLNWSRMTTSPVRTSTFRICVT